MRIRLLSVKLVGFFQQFPLNCIYNLYSEFLSAVNYFFLYFYLKTKLVDLSLLSASEIDWLDNYHSQVWEKVSASLDDIYSWLCALFCF